MDGGATAGPRVVALGGGTGLSTLLSGLKHHTSDLTAIVTVADDGGSSGRLRRDLGVLPPGDIRSCLEALAEDDSILRELFSYRFPEGELAGHSLGNLLLIALSDIAGSFEQAIAATERLLGAGGRVLPATLDQVALEAQMSDGRTIAGQARITGSRSSCRSVRLQPEKVQPAAAALAAVTGAELVVIGPGSLFTSLIPNLLIPELAAAVKAQQCRRLFVCNVMTQPGETVGFSAADHLETLQRHAGPDIVDTILVNTAAPPPEIVDAYAREGAQPVAIDEDRLESMGVDVLEADVGFAAGDYFRHDHARLGAAVMSLLGVRRGRPH